MIKIKTLKTNEGKTFQFGCVMTLTRPNYLHIDKIACCKKKNIL